MCRYAIHTYKSHFACFACRKAFKKAPISDYLDHVGLRAAHQKLLAAHRHPERRAETEARLGLTFEQIQERYLADVSVCPECGQRMAAMGLDFRAPPKRDREAWHIVEVLYANGFAFKGCGCGGPGVPPRRRSELAAWFASRTPKSAGAQLLEVIARKMSLPAGRRVSASSSTSRATAGPNGSSLGRNGRTKVW